MSDSEHIIFELGQWRVDSLAHTLTNEVGDEQVPAKVMAVLVHLAQNHERLVTRQELIDVVWDGNGYVGEKSLNNAVWRIRQVLDDGNADAPVIRTTPKTGYQLVPVPTFISVDVGPPPPSDAAPRVRNLTLIVPVVVALFAATGLIVRQSRPPTAQLDQPLTALTQMPGRELYAAPSPDGRQFAFMHVSPQGEQDLYLQSLDQPGEPPRKFSADGSSHFSPSWAPDSRHLAYLRINDQTNLCEVVVHDIQSNDAQAIDECLAVYQRTLSWSPDGKWLVHRKADSEVGPGLYLKAMMPNHKTSAQQPDRRISCTDCWLIDQEVSWSPDSASLAITRTKNSMSENVYGFDLKSWKFRRLTFGERSIEGHTWDKLGKTLIYVSDRHSLDRRMWALDVATGKKQVLGFDGAGFPAYLPDYRAILFYRRRAQSYIAAIKLNQGQVQSAFPQVVIQDSGSDRNPAYSSAAGKLAYHSNISGHNEIWIADFDGSNQKQVTHLETHAVAPVWSPGGDRLAFLAADAETELPVLQVYHFETDSIDTLAAALGEVGSPTWASDGNSVIVPVWRQNSADLWRVAADGNQLTRITLNGGEFGRESADGQYLYFTKESRRGLFRRSAEGGAETRVIDDMISSGYGNWTWAGPNSIIYARRTDDGSSFVRFDLETGTKQVLMTHPGRIVHRSGMLSFSVEHQLLYFTHMEPQQIDIIQAPDPLAGLTINP